MPQNNTFVNSRQNRYSYFNGNRSYRRSASNTTRTMNSRSCCFYRGFLLSSLFSSSSLFLLFLPSSSFTSFLSFWGDGGSFPTFSFRFLELPETHTAGESWWKGTVHRLTFRNGKFWQLGSLSTYCRWVSIVWYKHTHHRQTQHTHITGKPSSMRAFWDFIVS